MTLEVEMTTKGGCEGGLASPALNTRDVDMVTEKLLQRAESNRTKPKRMYEQT
jgi:hypothetical protein